VTPQGLSSITTPLAQGCCPHLHTINLSRTRFTGDVGHVLAQAMASRQLPLLQEIDLSNSELPPGNITPLATALRYCPNMRRIKVEGCALCGDDTKALGMALWCGYFPHLEELSLSCDDDDDVGDESLVMMMKGLASGVSPVLSSLRMCHVWLTTTAANALAHAIAIGSLRHLQVSIPSFGGAE